MKRLKNIIAGSIIGLFFVGIVTSTYFYALFRKAKEMLKLNLEEEDFD